MVPRHFEAVLLRGDEVVKQLRLFGMRRTRDQRYRIERGRERPFGNAVVEGIAVGAGLEENIGQVPEGDQRNYRASSEGKSAEAQMEVRPPS